jgi:hypothetical protein
MVVLMKKKMVFFVGGFRLFEHFLHVSIGFALAVFQGFLFFSMQKQFFVHMLGASMSAFSPFALVISGR